MAIYFIADLHLKETEEASKQLLVNFITKRKKNIDAIYILGDFFEFWIGDDYHTTFINSIKDLLLSLHFDKIPVFFMVGNRDFLIGKQFFQDTKCMPITDPYIIQLDNNKVLLTHGDKLIPATWQYSCFRKFAQNTITKALFLQLPKLLRLKIASYLRNNNLNNLPITAKSNNKIFTISEAIVRYYLQHYDINIIIHGHIHFPGIHDAKVANKHYKRFVLGDWGTSAKILSYEQGNFQLIDIY